MFCLVESLCYSLLLTILGLIVICSGVKGDEKPEKIQELFSRASCDFAIDLLKVESKGKEGNVVLSPSSVGVLLAILQQGAKENSLKQLDSVLGMTAQESSDGHGRALKSLQREKVNVTIEWGNRAYIRPGFQLSDSFNSTIEQNFQVAIEELNFVEPSAEEAAKTINSWVKQVTHDHIQNLISPAALTRDTVLLLLNAIYFKGLWDVPFKKILTKEDIFEPSPNNSVQAQFMSQKDRFIAGEDPVSGVKWVDLPFKDEQFSMLFILPVEKHGLKDVLEKMNGSLLKEIIDDDRSRQVLMFIPKFKLQEKVLLAQALKELGLTDIFTPDANLQGIASNFRDLQVSKIIHEAGIEVDEEGSTAFAATGMAFATTSLSKASDFLYFRADHPFLFFILDRGNKVPLFAGKVTNPSSGGSKNSEPPAQS